MLNGFFFLEDVIECGFVEEVEKIGFVWMKQKKEIKYKFDKIGRFVSYGIEVIVCIEFCKIKKLIGVKVRELLIWIIINEIIVDNFLSEKIVFKIFIGFNRIFFIDVFVVVVEEFVKEKVEMEAVFNVVKEV